MQAQLKPSATEHDRARLAAIAELAQHDDVPALIALLAEPSWSVRRGVISALATLGQSAVEALVRSLQGERSNETHIAATVDALVASNGDVESSLVALTATPNPAIAADIAQILGRRRNPRSIPTLIALLGHTDDNVAVGAIEALGRVGGRAAVDALVAAVEHDYFFRTYPAIDVLGRSGDPRAVAPLARLLLKSQYVLEAARALGRTADKAAVRPLTELLLSPVDMNVRVASLALVELMDGHQERYGSATSLRDALRHATTEAAARRVVQALAGADTSERVAMSVLLGALQNEAAVPALARLLDGVPVVASAAAEALKRLGAGADDRLRTALIEGDSARRQLLLPMFVQSRSSAAVLSCLKDDDANVRALACEVLAQMGESWVLPELFEQLSDANPRVSQAAMAAIQSLGSEQTEALTISAASSPLPTVRRAALRILSYFGYTNAIEVFAHAVRDVDARVRDVAIVGLAALEHPRARELLLAASVDPSERTRAAAMRGLGQSPADADIVLALQQALTDQDAWVRYYACQALGKLNVHHAAPFVVPLLEDSAGQVRVAAVEALSRLRSAEAADALRQAVSSTDIDVQRAALIGLGIMKNAAAVPVLTAACAAEDAATRMIALSALSALNLPETLPIVSGLLLDADENVRVAAVGVLATWPGSEATRLLTQALSHDSVRKTIGHALGIAVPGRIVGLLEALANADDELAPVLMSALGRVDPHDENGALAAALRSPNVPARKAAAAMLAARGTREALEALGRACIEDPSDEVRRVCTLLLVQ